MQETQQKAYFEPFEKADRHQGARTFAGSDPTKIKAMVETKNIEWDMAQLSRGSIMNLMKTGDYFEKIDYSLVDDGVDKAYRFEYGLEMLVWVAGAGLPHRRDQRRSARPAGPTSGTPRNSPATAPWSAPATAAGPNWNSP